MTESPADGTTPLQGVSLEVLLAGACFALGFASSSFVTLGPQAPSSFALLAGWPAFGIAGGILLDRRPGSPLGRVMALLALLPLVDVLWAAVRTGGAPYSADVAAVMPELAGAHAGLLAVALPWAMRPIVSGRLALGLAAVVAIGAATTAVALAGELGGLLGSIGWLLVGGGTAGLWCALLLELSRAERRTRRRVTWLIATLAATAAVVGCGWALLSYDVAGYVMAAALCGLALVTTRLMLTLDFRPMDEPLLDIASGIGALGVAGLISVLVGVGARLANLPSPTTSAVFAGLLTLGMAVPVVVWLRRTATARRYGTGTISPSDVALITADLHAHTEPRDLLERAARMVAAASGSRRVEILLGDDAPAVPEHWTVHPLVVGGDQVGTLAVEAAGTEGPELRQERVIAQLLPTVALVARAVGLAVETELARRDLSRERESERRRILGDLHDGLGPVLAGMSMRVQAAMRSTADADQVALLEDLARDLTTSRTDLRRLVAGLTPSALHEGDLESALDRLVDSFNGVPAGPRIALDVALAVPLSPDVQVAVYRSVAEGVTNALRHSGAGSIDVSVRSDNGQVRVAVTDDGSGGPVLPGVGLSSLARRAEDLGGRLDVSSSPDEGTRIGLEVPANAEGRA